MVLFRIGVVASSSRPLIEKLSRHWLPEGVPVKLTRRLLYLSPLAGRGRIARLRGPGEGASPQPERLERPPHPDPLPASGEREQSAAQHGDSISSERALARQFYPIGTRCGQRALYRLVGPPPDQAVPESPMNSAALPIDEPDVLVVGAGNAALCAAISAHEHGARVLILEAAPFEERGGNSHFTGGAFRFAFAGIDDLIAVLPSLAQENLKNVDFGTYTQEQFFDDLFALTQYRCDPDLTEILVRGSLDTAKWVVRQGVRLQPGLGRQAYQIDGKFKFWGGLALHIWGGGPELLKALYANVERRGIPILYETPAVSLLRERGRVAGVVAEGAGGEPVEIRAGAVVLACGSFESNPEMRARYLGPNWELAKSRGTRFNMGAGLRMALDIGARPYGNWSGCHSVAWDINAPPYGDLAIGDQFQKHNYPFGILVNATGERYVDEGANFHSHTYAKYGGEIVKL